MKYSNFFSITPIDYQDTINEIMLSNLSKESKNKITQTIRQHQSLIEIRTKILKIQEEIANHIFSFSSQNTDTNQKINPIIPEEKSDTSLPQPQSPDISPENKEPEITPTVDNNNPVKRKKLPEGKIFEHQLKESDKHCHSCGSKMHLARTKTKTIVVSTPLFSTETHTTESCHCLTCNQTHFAETPQIIDQTIGRFHYSAVVPLIALRYLYGMPSYRLEEVSANFGLPISDSTQWYIFEETATKVSAYAAFLNKEASNAPTGHTDDTNALIIEVARSIELEKTLALKKGINPDTIRSGIHTTNYTGVYNKGSIVTFATGLHHSGEIIEKLLEKRSVDEQLVIMTDASSCNTSRLKPDDVSILIANCNSHGYRKFKDIKKAEIETCKKFGLLEPPINEPLDFVIDLYKQIFENDRKSKKFSAEERLFFHQLHSMPLMEKMRLHIEDQFKNKKIEPNSTLGKAYSYFNNHFSKLVLFCKVLNAPVCNNYAERMLKKAIRHRKNSLFFKNTLGALVGDIFMTILATAQANGINPIQYLTDLLIHQEHWKKFPKDWLPWNYPATVKLLNTPSL